MITEGKVFVERSNFRMDSSPELLFSSYSLQLTTFFFFLWCMFLLSLLYDVLLPGKETLQSPKFDKCDKEHDPGVAQWNSYYPERQYAHFYKGWVVIDF